MTLGQLQRRIEAYTISVWPWAAREQNPEGYAAWKEGMPPTLAEANAAFVFNHQLPAYRAALARLAQYRLAEGQEAITVQRETGEVDADGNHVMETVTVSEAIDPLPATVTVPVFDDMTGQQIGETQEPNPAIVQDDAERAAAQAVVDATPDEVKQFDAGA